MLASTPLHPTLQQDDLAVQQQHHGLAAVPWKYAATGKKGRKGSRCLSHSCSLTYAFLADLRSLSIEGFRTVMTVLLLPLLLQRRPRTAWMKKGELETLAWMMKKGEVKTL